MSYYIRSSAENKLKFVWRNMKYRCYREENKDYKYYGGKGITMCDAWLSDVQEFIDWAFENGYDESLTIDREDSNKGYTPENCRWITQEANTRRSLEVLEMKDALEMRDLYPRYNHRELSEVYNCSVSTAERVVNRKTYKRSQSR